MAPAPCVLNIEDDAGIARVIKTLLERAGYRVISVADGRTGVRAFHEQRPDVVILDLGLPSLDGIEIIGRLRELSSVPILVLTARDSEIDKVHGLRSGADDYLTKPFGNAELVARVAALLRRSAQNASQTRGGDGTGGPSSFAGHGVEADFAAHTVTVGKKPVELTPTEFRLLQALVSHPNQVLSAEQLLRLAWRDPTATGPDRVKFTVLRLRRKLGWDPEQHTPIETVRGFGYRYRPPR